MAKYNPDFADPYFDSQNQCLKNILGILDSTQLDIVETNLTTARISEFKDLKLPQTFDLDYLKKIHRHTYQDIYSWAGELRSIDISRGQTRFAHYAAIEHAADKIFKKLKDEQYLSGLDYEKFSDRAGYYLGEINVLHPFREGNGRVQRVFLRQLALGNSFDINWSEVTQQQMIDASISAYRGDSKPLSNLINQSLKAHLTDEKLTIDNSKDLIDHYRKISYRLKNSKLTYTTDKGKQQLIKYRYQLENLSYQIIQSPELMQKANQLEISSSIKEYSKDYLERMADKSLSQSKKM